MLYEKWFFPSLIFGPVQTDFWSSPDRRKVIHMRPSCKLQRWAQKQIIGLLVDSYFNPLTNMRGPCRPRKMLKAAQTIIIGISVCWATLASMLRWISPNLEFCLKIDLTPQKVAWSVHGERCRSGPRKEKLKGTTKNGMKIQAPDDSVSCKGQKWCLNSFQGFCPNAYTKCSQSHQSHASIEKYVIFTISCNTQNLCLGDHPHHRTFFLESIIFSQDTRIVPADPATRLVVHARHGVGHCQSKCITQYRVT